MRSLFAAGAVFFVAITSGVAAEQGCTGQSEFINKNWYCSPVKSIHYTGVAGKGTYNKVTHINGETGACVKEPKEYGGTLAPLNEEVMSLGRIAPLKWWYG